MYLGVDYLVTRELKPYVVEVNVDLPGRAQEYDLAHRVRYGRPSDIFARIEDTSLRVYGRSFNEYLHSLPFMESLKPFKLWRDGEGPYPVTFHPGLRLGDKWVQYQLVKSIPPMPETLVFDPGDLTKAEAFFRKKRKLVLKRRQGRGVENSRSLMIFRPLFKTHFWASKLPKPSRRLRKHHLS